MQVHSAPQEVQEPRRRCDGARGLKRQKVGWTKRNANFLMLAGTRLKICLKAWRQNQVFLEDSKKAKVRTESSRDWTKERKPRTWICRNAHTNLDEDSSGREQGRGALMRGQRRGWQVTLAGWLDFKIATLPGTPRSGSQGRLEGHAVWSKCARPLEPLADVIGRAVDVP
jgi:hypothetical protein